MDDTLTLTTFLKQGDLPAQQENILLQVKSQPADVPTRELYFKILCLNAQWESALNQLEVIVQLDREYLQRTELYKNLVLSEIMRNRVLAGELTAGTLTGDSPEWMTILHLANKKLSLGDIDHANLLREQAFTLAPESAGEGENIGEFSWIADADGRIGPVCEFIFAGGYRWVPFSTIQTLSISEPQTLLDLLWAPSVITVNGQRHFGYIPARYPIAGDEEQNIKLGYRSEWKALSDSLWLGCGRKVLITDRDEYSIFDIKEITLR